MMYAAPDNAPFIHKPRSVTRVMLHVLIAVTPGAMAMIWYFGPGILFNILIAIATALASETIVLRLRNRPVEPALQDLSAVVTAVLLALALPPLLPWWATVIGTGFAIVVAKQLFGGLGFNPFNPAMAGYIVLLISFPREMTVWLPPSVLAEPPVGFLDTLIYTLGAGLPDQLSIDDVTMATPLDTMKTRLGLNDTIGEILTSPLFGDFGGRGWEWVGNWYFVGGLWLLYRRVISWHVPVAMLGTLFLVALVFYLVDPDGHPFALFHVFSGGAVLCAFFLATDPVSGCTSSRGRLVFGAGVGLLVYIIRTWGGYPDGIAFAVLIMNAAAPAIDYVTQPRVFGRRES